MKRKYMYLMIIACVCGIFVVGCANRKEKTKNEEITSQSEKDEKLDDTKDFQEELGDDEVLDEPTTSQDSWESTDSEKQTSDNVSQSNGDNQTKKEENKSENIEEPKEEPKKEDKKEESDSVVGSEPSVDVDGDNYFPLLP